MDQEPTSSENLVKKTSLIDFEVRDKESNKKFFLCNVCNKSFKQKSLLKKHMISHNGERKFLCEVCSKSFKQKSALKIHMLIHSGEKKFLCELCSKAFTQKVTLRLHMLKHRRQNGDDGYNNLDVMLFSCVVCQKSFANNRLLKTHTLIHSGRSMFSCQVCEQSFTLKHNLKRHMLRHGGENIFNNTGENMFNNTGENMFNNTGDNMFDNTGDNRLHCPVCKKSFAHKYSLRTHVSTHYRETKFRCTACDKTFSQKSNLYTHMVIHNGNKTFKCHICHKLFLQRTGLIQHMLNHGDEKTYKCYICHKSFSHCLGLIKHLLTHDGQNTISDKVCTSFDTNNETLHNDEEYQNDKITSKCPVCDKSFPERSLFYDHIRTHIQEKRYMCPECQKGFSTEYSLKLHMVVHSGEKTYICQLCSKGFLRRCHLKLHIQSHSVDRNHMCQICDKGFTTSHNLRNHMIIHKGETFSCEVCKKSFINRRSFSNHVLNHNRVKQYKCPTCEKLFANQGNFSRHKQTHHREKKHFCQICDKGFAILHYLKEHMTSHSGVSAKVGKQTIMNSQSVSNHVLDNIREKLFKDQICDQPIKQQDPLLNHTEIDSGENNERKKGFIVSFDLEEHTRTHDQEAREVVDKSITDGQCLSNNTVEHNNGKKQFRCPVCDKTISQRSNLYVHMKIHKGEKKNACTQCDKTFVTWHSLKQHVGTHNTERNHMCMKCGKGFTTSQYLRIHMKTHGKGEKIHICPECKKVFALSNELKLHLKTHGSERSGEKRYKSLACKQLFRQGSNLSEHRQTHKSEEKCVCPVCKKEFSLSKYLKKHVLETHYHPVTTTDLKEATPPKSVQEAISSSQLCESRSTWTTGVSQSLNVEEDNRTTCIDDRNYVCPECNKRFTLSNSLKWHMRKRHEILDLEERFMCDKTIRHRSNVYGDMLIHEEEKKHICPHCYNTFLTQCALQQHVVTHNTEKNHVCDKDFTTSQYLKTRTRKESAYENDNCQECNKPFVCSLDLKRHVRTHNAQNHICPKCGEAFTKKSQRLKRHTRRRANFELYKKSFESGESSSGHIPTRVRTYKCPVCIIIFRNNVLLTEHILETHFHPVSDAELKETRSVGDFISVSQPYKNTSNWTTGMNQSSKFKENEITCIDDNNSFLRVNGTTLSEEKSLFFAHTSKYECATCGHFFNRKYMMDRHLEFHTKTDVEIQTRRMHAYACGFCCRFFNRQIDVTKHFFNQHACIQ